MLKYSQAYFALLLQMLFLSPAVQAGTKEMLSAELGKLKSQTIPDMQDILLCMQTMNIVTSQYAQIKKVFLARETGGDDHLVNRFDANRVQHNAMLKELYAFVTESKDVEKWDRASLLKFIEDLTQHRGPVVSRFADLSEQEDLFIAQVGSLREYLLKAYQESHLDLVLLGGPRCQKANIQVGLKVLQEDLVQTLNRLNDLHQYTLSAARKRHRLLSIVYAALKIHAEHQYNNAAIASIDENLIALKSVLDLADFSDEYYQWRGMVAANGAAEGLDSFYLEYERPIRLIRIRIQEARNFEKTIKNISPLPESAQVVLGNIEGMIWALRKQEERLLNLGWPGQLKKQIEMTHRRTENLSALDAKCGLLLEDFLTFADGIVDLVGFRVAEIRYHELADTCSKPLAGGPK
jgi:hypothetical protein